MKIISYSQYNFIQLCNFDDPILNTETKFDDPILNTG